MGDNGQPDCDGKLKKFYDGLRRERQQTHRSYRDRALSLMPHVCALCGRDFEGKKLRELTVHHKDHNHDNNPPDGSNWELLCMYCHDEQHERKDDAKWYGEPSIKEEPRATAGFKAFEGLSDLLARKRTKE
jgi:5-methylcytosine-specific restriction endonuclease McrA